MAYSVLFNLFGESRNTQRGGSAKRDGGGSTNKKELHSINYAVHGQGRRMPRHEPVIFVTFFRDVCHIFIF